MFFDAEGNETGYYDIPEGDSNPADPNGESGLRDTDKSAMMARLKALGGAMEFAPEFWLTQLGRDLAEGGIGGFTVTDPPPEFEVGALGMENEDGHGGGTGGFDPMGTTPQEAIRQNRGQGGDNDDEDDDDNDTPPTHQGETFTGPPILVNPAPIPLLTMRVMQMRPISAVVGR